MGLELGLILKYKLTDINLVNMGFQASFHNLL